ncbi:S26 family signal peptidase [Synechococcus lacustris Tous-12m]
MFRLGRTTTGRGFWRSLLLPLALILLTRHFLLEARYIPSGSMLPGLQLQDRLMVEKLSSRQRSPRREK